MSKATDAEKAARIREALNHEGDLDGVPDERILKAPKGSLIEAQIDLNLAWRQLGRDLAAGLPLWQERWRRFGAALRNLR